MKNFVRECRQWQVDLLFELHQMRMGKSRDNGVDLVSTHLDRSARQEKEARFCRMILRRLNFVELPDRELGISKAYQDTFDWLFKAKKQSSELWANFTNWLEGSQGDNIYWITGKAGSGKSTLMKYLYNHPQTARHVRIWAKGSYLLTAGFFFWNSGSYIQTSDKGLLQSLLYQLMQEEPKFIFKAFEQRWELYDSRCEGLQPWTWSELKEAFKTIIAHDSLHFFFVIDGLDEFNGDHAKLVSLIISAGKRPNVKICTASRPWLVFEDAFEDRSSLLLENLTCNDINTYVTGKFNENKHYKRLRARDAAYAEQLIGNIVHKACGVFLWVQLVVRSLLQGLSNSDRISDLQRRLDTIPPGLEALFDKMLNSLEPFYYKHACQLIQTVEAAPKPLTLLQLYFADEEDPMIAMQAEVAPLAEGACNDMREEMRRRLNSRCKGLLEASITGRSPQRVQYLHRTVRDFLRQDQVWRKVVEATDNDFDPNKRLSNSFLLQLKGVDPDSMALETFWGIVSSCIYHVGGFRPSDEGSVQVAYLDELDKAAVTLTNMPNARGIDSWIQRFTLPPQPQHWASTRSITTGSFLEFALQSHDAILVLYARRKIEDMPLDARSRRWLASRISDPCILELIAQSKSLSTAHRKRSKLKILMDCF